MKKTYVFKVNLLHLVSAILFSFSSSVSFAQSVTDGVPQGINYQAIARDIDGKPIRNAALSVRLTIWNDSSLSGIQLPVGSVFEQISNVETNLYGLFTLVIGAEDVADFQNIPWGTGGIKYLQVDIDTTGTGATWVEMKPRSPLMSVPYALYAKNAAQATTADSALFAINAAHATTADTALYAVNAAHATNSDSALYAINAMHATTADSALYAINAAHATNSDSALYVANAIHATTADTASYAINAAHTTTADSALYATNATYATTATNATHATTADTAAYVQLDTNTAIQAGIVPAGGSSPNRVWKTDATGTPAWRLDSSGVVYKQGRGITINGDTINTVWTKNGNNIHNNNIGNVGVGLTNPDANTRLHVVNNSNMTTATTGQFIFGAGNATALFDPSAIYAENKKSIGNAGHFYLSDNTNLDNALFVETNGLVGAAILAESFGEAGAGEFHTSSSDPYVTTIYVENAGAGYAGEFYSSASGDSIATLYAENYGDGDGAQFFTNSNSYGAAAVVGINKGAGFGGLFWAGSNSANSAAIYAENLGAGDGGRFYTASSTSVNAIYAENSKNGSAGFFKVTDATNINSSAVRIETEAANSNGLHIQHNGMGTATPDYGVLVNNTGGGTTNVGGYFSAAGATNNYAIVVPPNGGNVGIGTASPTSILHTVASGAKTASYSGNLLTNTATSSTASTVKSGLEIKSTGTWSGTSASNIGLYVSSVTGGTNNYDAIFNGGGKVGIGTATPTNKLEVFGGASLFNPNGSVPAVVIKGSESPIQLINSSGLQEWKLGLQGDNNLTFSNAINASKMVLNQTTGNLEIAGQIKIAGGSPGIGKVLVSDAQGLASWAAANSIGAWSTTGNSGTAPGTNFIGTTDNKDFIVKTTNAERIKVFAAGQLRIGTSLAPMALGWTHISYSEINPLVPGLIISNSHTNANAIANITLINSSGNGNLGGGISLNNSTFGNSFKNAMVVGTYGPAYLQLITNKQARVVIDTINTGGTIGIATQYSPLTIDYSSPIPTSYPGLLIKNSSNASTAFSSLVLLNDANNPKFSGGIYMNSSTNSTFSGYNGMNIGTNGPAKLQLGTQGVPIITIDTAGNVGIGTDTSALTANARLTIKDGHLKSRQTNVFPHNITVGASNTISQYVEHATDIAGTAKFIPSGAGYMLVNFAKDYFVAPIVVITPCNAISATDISNVWITATTEDFKIMFNSSINIGIEHCYNYHVIETQ